MQPFEDRTPLEHRRLAREERQRANLRVPKVARVGASDGTLAIEAEAFAYCKDAGHSLRDHGRQACRDCAQEALMGRLGQARAELPPLSGVKDQVAVFIDRLLQSGGRWRLDAILAKVNDWRTSKGQGPYTETGCSARIRDLRKAGRTIRQEGEAGGAEYWMEVPSGPPADPAS